MGDAKLSLCRVDPVPWKGCLWQADSEHVTSLAQSSVALAAAQRPDNTVLQQNEARSRSQGAGTEDQKQGYIRP